MVDVLDEFIINLLTLEILSVIYVFRIYII